MTGLSSFRGILVNAAYLIRVRGGVINFALGNVFFGCLCFAMAVLSAD